MQGKSVETSWSGVFLAAPGRREQAHNRQTNLVGRAAPPKLGKGLLRRSPTFKPCLQRQHGTTATQCQVESSGCSPAFLFVAGMLRAT